MYRPFTFMVDNVRYITLLGLEMTAVIQKSDVVKFKNAMPFGVFMTSAIKPRPEMEKQAGVNFNTLPIADVKSAEEIDGSWVVDGTIDGKLFHLDASTVVYGDEVVFGNSTASQQPEIKPEQEQVKEQTKPAPVKEEPKPEPVKEEPKPVPAPVKEVPTPAPVREEPKPAPVKEEPKPAPVNEEPKPAPIKEETKTMPEPKEEFFYGFYHGSGKKKDSVTVLGNDGPSIGVEIGVEFVSRSASTTRQRRHDITIDTRPTTQKTRYPWQRVEDLDERDSILPKTPAVPSGVPTVAQEPVEKETNMAWLKTAPLDTIDRMEQLNAMAPLMTDTPADITPTEPIQAVHEDNKEVKEAFRSTLSPEINKVIGDIPHSALGSIEAFTTVDIDFSLLEQQGEVYCIDHRWQKFGKWYCIDIVNRYARYFYNPKLGVSIEIPTAVCKEWLNIISGVQQ